MCVRVTHRGGWYAHLRGRKRVVYILAARGMRALGRSAAGYTTRTRGIQHIYVLYVAAGGHRIGCFRTTTLLLRVLTLLYRCCPAADVCTWTSRMDRLTLLMMADSASR